MKIKVIFLPIMLALLGSACQRDEITSVVVPKEAAPTLPAMAGGAGTPMGGSPGTPGMDSQSIPPAQDRGITWKVPSSWIEETPNQIRVGSFKAKSKDGRDVDISVIPLSGEAGGLLANINRWRGQIQLAALSDADLPHELKTIHANGRSMTYVEFSNQGKRLAAAIYERAGQTWFFKMIGDDKSVLSQKNNFTKFLESLKFASHE